MNPTRFLTVSFCLVVGSLVAQPGTLDLRGLANAIQEEVDRDTSGKAGDEGASAQAKKMLLTQLRAATPPDDARQVNSILEQLTVYIDSPSLRQECKNLTEQMRKIWKEKQSLLAKEVDEVCQQAGEAIRSSRTPRDLDAALDKLEALRGRWINEGRPPSEGSPLFRVEPAVHFVRRWQDCLAAVAGGDVEKARQGWESMDNIDRAGLIARSEILARIRRPAEGVDLTGAFNTEVDDIINRIKTLDDISRAIAALKKAEAGRHARNKFSSEVPSALTALSPLEQAYASFKAGLAIEVELIASDRIWYPSVLLPLRAELLALVLPRSLGLKPDETFKPGEGAYEFLKRVATEAAVRGDYVLAARAQETEDLLLQGRKSRSPDGLQATLFITGSKQETAGQFSLAVTSYQQALASGSNLVPAEVIGKRLTAIKAAHQKEFEQGVEQYLRPRIVPPGMQMGSSWMPALRQPPEAAPNLPVPAPTISPVPAPSQP